MTLPRILLLSAGILLTACANQTPTVDGKTYDSDLVDQGDLIDLHNGNGTGISLWNDDKGDGLLNKDDDKPVEKIYHSDASPTETAAVPSTQTSSAMKKENTHQRYEIRQRYSLSAPNVAIEELYSQMAAQCTNGWKKQGERSEKIPNSSNYYLYYTFECL